MYDLASKNGVKTIIGEVINVIYSKNNDKKVCGIQYISENNGYSRRRKKLKCDIIIICMGPWSCKAYKWFPKCTQLKHINGLKNNSIIYDTKYINNKTPKQGLFIHYNKVRYQLYPRINNTIYSMSKANDMKLPDNNYDIKFDDSKGNKMIKLINNISEYTRNGNIKCKQSCYYPMSNDGNPLIGNITGCINGYIGSGHGCWGILLGPITGKILSELIIHGKIISINEDIFKAFNPDRKIINSNENIRSPPKKRRRIK